MIKTLEEAIGCWTARREYNDLTALSDLVSQSARWCRRATLDNSPVALRAELTLLRTRIKTLDDLAASALTRLNEIERTGELKP